VGAQLERDGDVEADGQQCGEQQTAKLHASIVPGDAAAPRLNPFR
jgi:hypothetical protein